MQDLYATQTQNTAGADLSSISANYGEMDAVVLREKLENAERELVSAWEKIDVLRAEADEQVCLCVCMCVWRACVCVGEDRCAACGGG